MPRDSSSLPRYLLTYTVWNITLQNLADRLGSANLSHYYTEKRSTTMRLHMRQVTVGMLSCGLRATRHYNDYKIIPAIPASRIAGQSRVITDSGWHRLRKDKRIPSDIRNLAQERTTSKRARLWDLGCYNGLVTGVRSCFTPFTGIYVRILLWCIQSQISQSLWGLYLHIEKFSNVSISCSHSLIV